MHVEPIEPIAHVATIPIMIFTDFDSLEQHGQTGRCHDDIGGDLFGPENTYLAGAHIGGG